MGGSKAKKNPSKKYGVPLYCAAWPPGDLVYLAGGGGGKGHGIANRVIVAKHHNGELSQEEVTDFNTGNDAPLRMLMFPDGQTLLLAMGKGGLLCIDIDTKNKVPKLSASKVASAEELAGLGQIKCLAISNDMRVLALGGEDGSVQVRDWPSLRSRMHISGKAALKEGVQDIDISGAHRNKVLATTCEAGTCILWDWEKGERITSIYLPQDLEGCSFRRCRFARDGTKGLYTTVTSRAGGIILLWQQNEMGEMVLVRRVRAHNSPMTAFDISADGRILATGTSEGEVALFNAERLSVVRRVKDAHMIFVTALAIAPDRAAMLSVSADASARATLVAQPPRPAALGFAALLFALLVVLIGVLILQAGGILDPKHPLESLQELQREILGLYNRYMQGAQPVGG